MEDFATYEIAVKLKEKGYPQRYYGKYSMTGACYFNDGRFYEDGCIANVEDCCTAPTISQALKWLREDKGLHIEIQHIFYEETLWDFEVVHIGSYDRWWNNSVSLDSYEQAALAGIEYVLDNLI